MARYSITEAAKLLINPLTEKPISPSTLRRWEREGTRPAPHRLARGRRDRLYDDQWIAATRAWMEQLQAVQNEIPRNSLQGKRKKMQEKA